PVVRQGEDSDPYENGTYVGHFSPYSRPWLTHPRAQHTLRITPDGDWRADADQPCMTEQQDGRTAVAFRTVDGRPVQACGEGGVGGSPTGAVMPFRWTG